MVSPIETSPETLAFEKKRRLGFVVALLVIVAVVAGIAFFLLHQGPGQPARVAVVMRGSIDPIFDERFHSLIMEELFSYGLEAIAEDEPLQGDDLVRSARELARRVDAGHTLVLDLSSNRERDGSAQGAALYAVELTLHLVPNPDDRPARSQSMEFTYERTSAGEVATAVGIHWIEGLLPSVVEWLIQSPTLEPMLQGKVSIEETARATKIQALQEPIATRSKITKEFDEYCSRERERLQVLDKANPRPITCTGNPCGQWTLIGLDAQDRVVIQDMSRTPLFKILDNELTWIDPPERIIAFSLDAPEEQEVLLRAGHFYGYGEISPDGRLATVQPFTMGEILSAYTLDISQRQRHDVSVLSRYERISRAIPAPDGSGVALQLRSGATLFTKGNNRFQLPRIDQARWITTEKGLRLAGRFGRREIIFISPEGAVDEPGVELPSPVARILPLHQGTLPVILRNEFGCALVRVDIQQRTVTEPVQLLECLDWPQMLSDGRLLGTAEVTSERDVPGDPEVVVLDPERNTITVLTSGAFEESGVYPTRDQKRVVFNRDLERWPEAYNQSIYRRVVCWMDIPAR
jgi:hypothetical protein